MTNLRTRRTVGFTVVSSIYLVLVVIASGGRWVECGQLAVAGLGIGAIAALSGVGIVLTFQATGVLNLAQGGIATVAAFCFALLVTDDGVPVAYAAIIAIVITGPALGLLAELFIFRRLDRRGASTSERLVANLGVLVFLLAICVLAFGETSRLAPGLFPSTQAFAIGPEGHQVPVSWSTVGNLLLLLAGAGGLTLLLRRTPFGRQIRAVVDRRGLAELDGIDAVRTSAFAWALGGFFAALVGVLYAPLRGLEVGYVTLTVLETLSVAVIARLKSIPVAVVAGLGLGITQSLSVVLTRPHWPGWLSLPHLPSSVSTELFVLATLGFLLFDRAGRAAFAGSVPNSGGARLVTGSFSRAHRGREAVVRSIPAGSAVTLTLLAPLVLSVDHLGTAQLVIGYAVAFLSIVAVTGMAGHITLATAAFAGLGAYITSRLSNGYLPLPSSTRIGHVPVLIAMLIAVLIVVPLGVALGLPALRRRGLVLALLTLAFAQAIDALIFQQPHWVSAGLSTRRPSLGPVALDGNRAFTLFELLCLAGVLFLVRNLRSGALGRALGAIRDSDLGAQSVGLSLRRNTLLVFGVGAGIAALGGSLLAESSRTVDLTPGGPFSPLSGLYWFAAVVVCGLSFRLGAVLGGVLFVVIDAVTGQSGAGLLVIGLLAMLQGYLPGGLVGTALRARGARAGRVGPIGLSLVAYAQDRQRADALPPVGRGLERSPLAAVLVDAERRPDHAPVRHRSVR